MRAAVRTPARGRRVPRRRCGTRGRRTHPARKRAAAPRTRRDGRARRSRVADEDRPAHRRPFPAQVAVAIGGAAGAKVLRLRMARIRREPAIQRLPVERLVAVPVVFGGRDEGDDAYAGRLRTLDGLRQRQPLLFVRPPVGDRLGLGRQRPAAPVGLADPEERSRRAKALERWDEPAVDERGAEAERGVVAGGFERRSVGLDELDSIFEPRLRDAFSCGGEELRRALDAGDPAPELLGKQARRPAAAGGDVEDVRTGPETEPLAEQPNLVRTGRVHELVLGLDDGMPPGPHRRPRRYASYSMRRPRGGCPSTGSKEPPPPPRARHTSRSPSRAPMCGESARTRLTSSCAGAPGSSSRSSGPIFSAYVAPSSGCGSKCGSSCASTSRRRSAATWAERA